MKQFIQDLIVSAFGLVASIIVAFLLMLMDIYGHFSFYTFSYWFVIPVGAIGCGFVAASGYYFGARLFNHRPTPLLLLNMGAVSVSTFFLIRYLSYITMEIKGVAVSDVIPFLDYLGIVFQSTSISLVRAPSASTGELGQFGFVIALLQIIGFAIGGVALYFWLRSLPYCEKCLKYFSKKGKQDRFTSGKDDFVGMVKEVAEFLSSGQLQEAIKRHSNSGNFPVIEGNFLKSVLSLWKCKKCGINCLKFSAYKGSGDKWTEINDLALINYQQPDLKTGN